jgi:hypothetical protein
VALNLCGHKECPQCNRSLRLIEQYHAFIDKAALGGMQRSGERVAVFIDVRKKATGFLAIPLKTLIEIEDNEELKAAYQRSCTNLKPGETLVIVAFPNEEHFGVYKLYPGLLT